MFAKIERRFPRLLNSLGALVVIVQASVAGTITRGVLIVGECVDTDNTAVCGIVLRRAAIVGVNVVIAIDFVVAFGAGPVLGTGANVVSAAVAVGVTNRSPIEIVARNAESVPLFG